VRYIYKQHIPDFVMGYPEFDMSPFFFTQPITANLAVYTDLSRTQLMNGHCQHLHFWPHCIECSAVWSRERCQSVCLSVKRVDCDKMEEKSV